LLGRTIKIKNTIKPTTEITLTKYHHPLLPISSYLRTDIDTVGKANIAIYSSPEVLPPEFQKEPVCISCKQALIRLSW